MSVQFFAALIVPKAHRRSHSQRPLRTTSSLRGEGLESRAMLAAATVVQPPIAAAIAAPLVASTTSTPTTASSAAVKVAAVATSDFDFTTAGGVATITKYRGSGGDVTIPSMLGGAPVKAIGANAFNGTQALTTVVIPSSVTSIGDQAFLSQWKLTNLTLPASVTSMGVRVFYQCDNLQSVTFASGFKKIPDQGFAYCKNLISVNIPNTVTDISANAFYGCDKLTRVVIPASVKNIGQYAFAGGAGKTIDFLGNAPQPDRQITIFNNQTVLRYNPATSGWPMKWNLGEKACIPGTSTPPAPQPPSMVTNVKAVGGTRSATVTWTAPFDGGSAIRDYFVQFSNDSGKTWKTFARPASTVCSVVVTGLTSRTGYSFRVAAVNGINIGSYSAATPNEYIY